MSNPNRLFKARGNQMVKGILLLTDNSDTPDEFGLKGPSELRGGK